MYPGKYVELHPDRPAVVMASTGESVSYAEYEVRTNELAHYLRAQGLNFKDHYSIFMENNARYIECCGAGERTGLIQMKCWCTPNLGWRLATAVEGCTRLFLQFIKALYK